jgi:predicted transcriptional regulator
MPQPKLSKLELQVMDLFWSHGSQTVREIQERFAEKGRPAYTTVQTVVTRLEAKAALARARKLGNAHVFEATVSRNAAQRRLVDDFLALFGGRMQPLMSSLVESGKLTLEDVAEAERRLQELARKKEASK